MADTQKNINSDDIVAIAKKGFDEITGFGEGIAQFIHDRPLRDTLGLMAGGALSIYAFLHRIDQMIGEAPDEQTIQQRQMVRDLYQDLITKYASQGAEALKSSAQAIAKALSEAYQRAKVHDRQVATPAVKSAVARMEDDGFPGLAGVFKSLAGTLGIETETSTEPTTPAPTTS